MKKLIIFILFSGGSLSFAAFKTDALNVTGSSVTVNGVSYIWPSSGGTSGQCLTTDGGNPQVLSWTTCGSTPPVATFYVLLEDATNLLLEDNTPMLLESP